MALTGLHTDWVKGSYLNDRNYFVGQKENPSGPYTRPYYDGSIAIGYGFDLMCIPLYFPANRKGDGDSIAFSQVNFL